MKQIYDNYTAEDFEVWKILFDRQIKQFPSHASNGISMDLRLPILKQELYRTSKKRIRY